VIRRLARLQYRVLDRLRHRESFRVGRAAGTARDFAALRGAHYALVVTFKRSGEAVPTPVLFGVDGDRLFFRTEPDVAKVRRLRNDSRVRVGPCNWRARPTGPMTDGTARILPAAEADAAYATMRANYTPLQRVYEGAADRLPVDLAYVEVVPSPAG
jgi:PPOX class probable F420-dependent enzyme